MPVVGLPGLAALLSRRTNTQPDGGVMVSPELPTNPMSAMSTSPAATPAGLDSVTLLPPVAELLLRYAIDEYVPVYWFSNIAFPPPVTDVVGPAWLMEDGVEVVPAVVEGSSSAVDTVLVPPVEVAVPETVFDVEVSVVWPVTFVTCSCSTSASIEYMD